MNANSGLTEAYDEWKSSTGQQKDAALLNLMKEMKRFAVSICWTKIPEHDSAFDSLISEITWRAIGRAPTFKNKSKFSTWFYRIASNECNRFLRQHKQRGEIVLDLLPVHPRTSEGAIDAHMDVLDILARLHGDDHLMFKMLAEGEDFQTIANTLGIKYTTAVLRWSRLKARLKDACR